MDVKTKILFITGAMRGGGAEKVLSTVVSNLDRDKFDIALALLKKEGKYLKEINSEIKIIDLNSYRLRNSLYKIYKLIKNEKPDIVFSTLGHINIFILMVRIFLPKNIKYILREAGIVSKQNQYEKFPKIFNYLYLRFYPKCDRIIAQSHYMKNDLISNYGIKEENIVVINNPVKSSNTEYKTKNNTDKLKLLFVGRFTHEKGSDLLIESIRELKSIDYELNILGDGPLKKDIIRLVKQYGLSDKVIFHGEVNNPLDYMKNATLLLLTSRNEGFPNVLLEAGSCGLPFVAFDSPGGIGEIVLDGINGFLVTPFDTVEFADLIMKAHHYNFDHKRIIEMTHKSYNVDTIIKQYEEVLLSC